MIAQREISVGRSLSSAKTPIKNIDPTPDQTPPMNRIWLSCVSNLAASVTEIKSPVACQPSVRIPPSPTFSPKKTMTAPARATTIFRTIELFTFRIPWLSMQCPILAPYHRTNPRPGALYTTRRNPATKSLRPDQTDPCRSAPQCLYPSPLGIAETPILRLVMLSRDGRNGSPRKWDNRSLTSA